MLKALLSAERADDFDEQEEEVETAIAEASAAAQHWLVAKLIKQSPNSCKPDELLTLQKKLADIEGSADELTERRVYRACMRAREAEVTAAEEIKLRESQRDAIHVVTHDETTTTVVDIHDAEAAAEAALMAEQSALSIAKAEKRRKKDALKMARERDDTAEVLRLESELSEWKDMRLKSTATAAVLTPADHAFHELDRNGDGIVTLTDCELWLPVLVRSTDAEDLPPVLRKLKQNPKALRKKAYAIFRLADTNNDGQLVPNEFAALYSNDASSLTRKQAQARIKAEQSKAEEEEAGYLREGGKAVWNTMFCGCTDKPRQAYHSQAYHMHVDEYLDYTTD
jgi:hypothetical protein